jgi:hypothetical protein
MRLVAHWFAWSLLLFGLWLAYVGTLAWTESAVGAAAAGVAAVAVEAVRAQGLLRFPVSPHWVRRTLRVPYDVIVDFGIITAALVGTAVGRGRPHGRLKTVEFHPRGAAGSRAVAAWAGTISPNEYVLDVHETKAVTHALVPSRSRKRLL